MKQAWPRIRPLLTPERDVVLGLLAPVTAAERVEGWAPLAGGLTHTTLKVTRSDGPPLVLRLFQGSPDTAALEATLSARCGQVIRMPTVLHHGREPLPFTLSPFIGGTAPHRLWPGFTAAGREQAARGIGHVLAAVHGAVTFDRTGFLGPDLRVAFPVLLGGDGLRAFLQDCLIAGPGGDRLGADLTQAALRLAESRGAALDAWTQSPCLVHSDFNPHNLLMDDSGQVTAVLDWEFAHAGTPATDFGNLLRPPLGDDPAFARALAEGYRAAGGTLPEDWRRLAGLADLFAWADMLRRPGLPEAIVHDARRMVARIIADWRG